MPTLEDFSEGYDVITSYPVETVHYDSSTILTGDYFDSGFYNVYDSNGQFIIFYEDGKLSDGRDVEKGTYLNTSLITSLIVKPQTVLDPVQIKVDWDGVINKPNFALKEEFHKIAQSGSWNDLEDKPFYENIVRNNVIISPKTFPHRGLDVNNVSDRIQSECDKPEEGDEIEVIFDGMHYHCTVERYTGSNFNHMTYIGNMRICYNSDTFEDNGMPFAVKFNHVTSGETSWNDIFVIDEESEHTIEAFVGSYELKQIESKYVVGFENLKPGQALVAKTVNADGTPNEFAGADVFSGNYNDLYDRPCYDNIVIGEEVIENQEVPAGSSNVTVKSEYKNDNPYAFPATDCIVYYDGVEYVCKVLVDGPAMIYGNPAMDTNRYNGVEHPNNGLPFAMTYNRSNRKCTLYSMDTTVSHTISARFAQIEFKQLDEKFIPDTIARVSDIENVDDLVIIEVNEMFPRSASSAIKEAVDNNKTIIAKVESPSGKIYTSTQVSYSENNFIVIYPIGSDEKRVISWDDTVSYAGSFVGQSVATKLKTWNEERSGDKEWYPSVNAMEEYVQLQLSKELTAEDAIALATETGLIDPIATTSDNTILTDVNNNIITL